MSKTVDKAVQELLKSKEALETIQIGIYGPITDDFLAIMADTDMISAEVKSKELRAVRAYFAL